MIRVGQKVRVHPLWDDPPGVDKKAFKQMQAAGVIIAVNHRGGWFLVEYEAGGTKLRSSYRLEDIDEGKVVLLGRR